MARRLKGIRRKRGKWQVFVKIDGKFHSTTMPLQTPLEEMQAWQTAAVQRTRGTVAPAESFAADIQLYLQRVAAMPTKAQRAAHLDLWAGELGRDRSRHSITDAEIEIVLQRWLTAGLASATVRKRRTALQSFFVKMNGKGKANPVKATTNPAPPKTEARAIDYLAIERLLSQMPTYRDVKKGEPRPLALATIRARVIAYTGLPPGLLAQIVPDDLSFTARTVHIGSRAKGAGVEARTLPLTDEGLAAFKAFHAANAYGPFAIESVNRAVKRAATKAGITLHRFHLYDLRHSFLAEAYRVTGDEATVARLGLHAEHSVITKRYTKGAHADVDQAAVAAFSQRLATLRQGAIKPAVRRRAPQKKLRVAN